MLHQAIYEALHAQKSLLKQFSVGQANSRDQFEHERNLRISPHTKFLIEMTVIRPRNVSGQHTLQLAKLPEPFVQHSQQVKSVSWNLATLSSILKLLNRKIKVFSTLLISRE